MTTLMIAIALLLAPAAPPDPHLQTIAESTGFRGTATHADVVELSERLAAASPNVVLSELGRTEEGKSIPLLIISDPPISSAAEAHETGKVIVFVLGAIHGGEICGKEAMLMLAREIATGDADALLRDVVLVFAPVYNADGNDRMALGNRPGQAGPELGMGQRHNTDHLDLNRDYIKLKSSEARGLVRFLNEWDPHVTVDTHTTNGSYHRYTLTYDIPLNPSGHAAPIAFLRDRMLPDIRERLRTSTGYDTFWYGNFNAEHTTWTTYSPLPRFGGSYQGLRGQMSILSEAHTYASYRDRVLCTREFVREIIRYAGEHREQIIEIHDRARRETIEAGRLLRPDDLVGLRHRPAAYRLPTVIHGYVETTDEDGHSKPTTTEQEYTVVHIDHFEPTVSVRRPHGYLIPASLEPVLNLLTRHGIESRAFEGRANIEQYTITSIDRADKPFQDHHLLSVEVESKRLRNVTMRNTRLIRTAQPLGNLLVYLLEPQSDDGVVTWGFLGSDLVEGGAYPIMRVQFADDLMRRSNE